MNFYVSYFADSKEVWQFSNVQPNSDDFIVINNIEDLGGLYERKDCITNYKVNYDSVFDKYYITSKVAKIKNTSFIEIKEFVYADIFIVQDFKSNKWKFILSDNWQIDYNPKKLYFSICKNNNPNILIRLIEINFNDLFYNKEIIIPFQYQIEKDKEKISIFTHYISINYSYKKNYE